jgi:glycosyltransferase involved in cell wall biosynthesis
MRCLIVIPTFQRAHQIGRAIAAALAQSLVDVLVAVVDDGSSDDTEGACRPWFGDPRFVYLRTRENRGTAAAKNLALAVLAFDAVTFHDSDDLPHRDKLLRQQRTLMRGDCNADPCLPWHLTGSEQPAGAPARIDVVLSAHEFLAADGSRTRIARTLSLVDDFFPNVQFGAGSLGDWVLINSGLFRRSLFTRIGGYRDSIEEDRDLRNRALMAGANLWFIDEVLLSKYDESDSLTAAAVTGCFSGRRLADREAVWRDVAAWRRGEMIAPIPIDLADPGLSFVSNPGLLQLADDIPLSAPTRDWLTRDIARLRDQ